MNNTVDFEVWAIKRGLDQIADAVGKQKQAVVKSLWGDQHVEQALLRLLDPTVTFHLKEKSLQKEIKCPKQEPYDSFFRMCDDLASKRGLSDMDIARVQDTLDLIQEEDLRLYAEKFLCKSITLGISAKTVNKALGRNEIPVMEVMLANKYFDHPHEIDGRSFTITEKLDGIRCIAIVIEGKKPVLLSRQGQPIEGLDDVEKALEDICKNAEFSFVLDGELLISDRELYSSKEQYKLTTKIVRKDGLKSGVTYNVFDMIYADSFMWGLDPMPYDHRRRVLNFVFARSNSCWLKLLPVLYSGRDIAMVHECLEEQRALDHEGIMINLNGAPYVFGRTSNLLKVKVMSDCDLEIIGVQEGKGKFEGTLGALIVDYKGNPVGVGSGLSDEIRAAIWADPDKYIGRVATIQYFEETNDADGKLSIRFPVFKELREAGKEVSYS